MPSHLGAGLGVPPLGLVEAPGHVRQHRLCAAPDAEWLGHLVGPGQLQSALDVAPQRPEVVAGRGRGRRDVLGAPAIGDQVLLAADPADLLGEAGAPSRLAVPARLPGFCEQRQGQQRRVGQVAGQRDRLPGGLGGAGVALAGQLEGQAAQQPAAGLGVQVGAEQQPQEHRDRPLVDHPVRPRHPRRRLGPGGEGADDQVLAADRLGHVDRPLAGGPRGRHRPRPHLRPQQLPEQVDLFGGAVAADPAGWVVPGGDPLLAVQRLGEQRDGGVVGVAPLGQLGRAHAVADRAASRAACACHSSCAAMNWWRIS